ncbi:hypothetical protein AMECASPLE_006725 [Ameca splendens]|uniref:Uncharacterized protein n=1 Tax=Ameca splendens TaxID=208324 RepID=A0ABV0ZW36_9TELE
MQTFFQPRFSCYDSYDNTIRSTRTHRTQTMTAQEVPVLSFKTLIPKKIPKTPCNHVDDFQLHPGMSGIESPDPEAQQSGTFNVRFYSAQQNFIRTPDGLKLSQ